MKMETMMEEGEEYLTQDENDWSTELDISQLCRICANPNEYLIPIFHGEGIDHELNDKINKHLPIKVTESDKLPTHLCYQCASTLIAWHDMVVGCLEADDKLRALAKLDKADVEASEVVENDVKETKPQHTNDNEINLEVQDQSTVENMLEISSNNEEALKEISVLENQKVVAEEEVSSVQPEIIQEVPSEPSELIVVKTEEVSGEVSEPMEEEDFQEVEVYEDVETSVVVHDFVEGLQDGQYIAYIGDGLVESSVEVINQDIDGETETLEETKLYICEDCGKFFSDLVTFKNHLSSHQNKGHYCNYCDANYKRIDHLQKHIEIMHPNSTNIVLPKEKKVNPYAKTFLCNTCGKILKSSIAYENHTLKHQSKCPYPCAICSETFPNRGARRRHEVKEHNLLTKENGNPDGYHVCEICGLEMFSDGAYYHHKDKHGDPYPCGFCGKLYGSRSLMQVHARRHTTERPFVCGICNRNFKVKQELNAHMNIHKDLRPYQCPHCPKMCRKSSDLTHHIRTHTGEKPYICDKCGRGFAQAGDMRKHRQLHFRPSKINKNPLS